MTREIYFYLFSLFLISATLSGQQVIDSTFTYEVKSPAYDFNTGPVILIDEFHNNDMSIKNRMFPLIKVLKDDGYRIKPLKESISSSSLAQSKLLVIIGALHGANVDNWKLPTPDALSDEEVIELMHWIHQGGNLLLVADHMPFPGAVKNLTHQLGVEWYNGFVIDSINWGMSVFSKRDNTLNQHEFLNGRAEFEQVNWVATYYGSGFKIKDSSIVGLFSFNNKDIVSYQTVKAWEMGPNTPIIPSDKLYQAAIMNKGRGKVALIGEASLFSAQLVGKDENPVGINFQNDHQNLQFVLNLFHWLSGVFD